MRRQAAPWHPPSFPATFATARRVVRSALADAAGEVPPLLEPLGGALGLPLRLLGIDPVAEPASPPAVAPLARGWCLHLRTAAGEPFGVRFDDALAAGLAAEVFGVEAAALPADGGGEPVAGVLAALTLRALDVLAAAGRPLELVDLHRIATAEDDTGRVRVSLRLLAGERVGRAEAAVRPREPAVWSAPARPAWLDAVPVELAAVCARGRLRRRELLALQPGDAVTFDEWAAAEAEEPLRGAWLEPRGAGPGGPRWSLRSDAAGRWTVADRGPEAGPGRTAMTTDGADRTEVNLETERGGSALDAVPIEVTAVVGRATLTVGALGALRPGDVVPLGRSPGSVELLAHGVPFARGRLVELDGELAVELTELRTAPTAPPGG